MTGRERLAKVLSRALTDADAWIESAEVPRLTDAALAHIAAVLHDDATVEAVDDASIGHCLCGHDLGRHHLDTGCDHCECTRTIGRATAEAILAVLAERLGVPHVDR